jgi:tetratricopeptide (TPR) repeat protein
MSPRTWQRIKEVYTEASEMPAEDRESFVGRVTTDQPKIADEVLRLLRLDAEAERRFEPIRVPAGLLNSAAERRTFFPGERLAERYEIRRFLAVGGMGEVYEADDLERGERIAIKTIRAELTQDSHINWLRREVDAARRMQHPNICRVYDLVQTGSHTFLTMEMLEGETLAAYLQKNGSMSERQALPWIRQMIAGLAAAHRAGVVHRDFKPGNLMLVPRPNGAPRAVIMDFGLARHTNRDGQATFTSQTWSQGMGTPAYMAPEQIEGRRSTPATDIYCFGIVLFEMLTGELPFASDSPLNMAVRKTRENAPTPLLYAPTLRRNWARVISKCLEANPSERFEKIEEVLPALESRSSRIWQSRLLLRKSREMFRHSRTKAIVGVLLLGLALLAWKVWPVQPTATAMQEWQRGIESLRGDEPLAALEFLERARDTGRAPWRTQVDLALAWKALKVDARAQEILKSTSTLFASEADQSYLKAAKALLAERKQEAVEVLEKRAAQSPLDASLLADLAWVAQGPADRWRQVVHLQPDQAAAHFQIGDLAAREGKWREAESAFEVSNAYFGLQKNPKLQRAVAARRGLRRLEAGDVDLARQDLASFVTLPPGYGVSACEHVAVIQAGIKDNFAQPADAMGEASPGFSELLARANQHTRRGFDEPANNQQMYLSIPLPPVRICAAKLEFHIRRGADRGGAMNDFLQVGAAPFKFNEAPPQSFPLWADAPSSMERTVTIDLTPETFANVMRAYAGKPIAMLDIFAGDDTEFDYIKVTLFY